MKQQIGIHLQNIQTVHAAQYKKQNQQPNQKMGGRPKFLL